MEKTVAKTKKDIRNALTAAEYWEWRLTIELGNVAREKLRSFELELKLMQKDAEILQERAKNFLLTRIKSSRDVVDEMKAEYNKFKAQLEDSLGQSLNGKMITETFDIVDLPQDNQTK